MMTVSLVAIASRRLCCLKLKITEAGKKWPICKTYPLRFDNLAHGCTQSQPSLIQPNLQNTQQNDSLTCLLVNLNVCLETLTEVIDRLKASFLVFTIGAK